MASSNNRLVSCSSCSTMAVFQVLEQPPGYGRVLNAPSDSSVRQMCYDDDARHVTQVEVNTSGG